MNGLHKISSGKGENEGVLSKSEQFSVYYHDLFDYPLTFAELIKWNTGKESFTSIKSNTSITSKNGYFFLKGRERLIYKKVCRVRISSRKMEIAKKASNVLSLIPGIKMIAVTGSLAMENSTEESDIDLMIITKKGALWTTRLLSYLVLCTMHYALRKPLDDNQRDALCLNMWLDESDLVWRKRNLYTAHEIAQILPLVNKKMTYEKFLYKNRWILKYWPNATRISEKRRVKSEKLFHFSFLVFPLVFIERICYWFQYRHMKSKITREVVNPTRAVFHPVDLEKTILTRLYPLG